jgi:hypothetical protein
MTLASGDDAADVDVMLNICPGDGIDCDTKTM